MNKTLESFKLKEAWTYLFKEKQWGLKLAIPFLPGILVVLAILIVVIPLVFLTVASNTTSSSTTTNNFFATIAATGSIAMVCLCCLIAVIVVIYGVIANWTQYEYWQASMEDRETKLITKENAVDVIKKVVKLLLVNTIYNIPTSLLLGFFYVLFIVTGGVRQTSYVYGMRNTSDFSAMGLLMLCIIMLIVFLVVIPYNFYIVQTAKARLIKTNTFVEAFRVRTIIDLVKRNFKRLSLSLGVFALYVVVYILISVAFSVLSVIPFVSLCLLPFNLILSLAVSFFGVFVYPYMLGKVYKEVK